MKTLINRNILYFMEETMHIIIVGCGKVGRTLADQLQEEDTDLTLIDTDPDVINDHQHYK